jgi:hypothetical protein
MLIWGRSYHAFPPILPTSNHDVFGATITTLQQFMDANRDVAKQSWPHASSAASAPAEPSAPAQTSASASQIPPATKSQTPDVPNTEAAQAWWNMLTQQFGQLAAATTASMAATPEGKTSQGATAAHAAKKEKSAVTKTATRTRSNSKKPVTRTTVKK